MTELYTWHHRSSHLVDTSVFACVKDKDLCGTISGTAFLCCKTDSRLDTRRIVQVKMEMFCLTSIFQIWRESITGMLKEEAKRTFSSRRRLKNRHCPRHPDNQPSRTSQPPPINSIVPPPPFSHAYVLTLHPA